MKNPQFTAPQIAQVFKESSNGKSVEELIREYGVSKVTIYNWRKKYGGMEASDMTYQGTRGRKLLSEADVYQPDHRAGHSQIHYRKSSKALPQESPR